MERSAYNILAFVQRILGPSAFLTTFLHYGLTRWRVAVLYTDNPWKELEKITRNFSIISKSLTGQFTEWAILTKSNTTRLNSIIRIIKYASKFLQDLANQVALKFLPDSCKCDSQNDEDEDNIDEKESADACGYRATSMLIRVFRRLMTFLLKSGPTRADIFTYENQISFLIKAYENVSLKWEEDSNNSYQSPEMALDSPIIIAFGDALNRFRQELVSIFYKYENESAYNGSYRFSRWLRKALKDEFSDLYILLMYTRIEVVKKPARTVFLRNLHRRKCTICINMNGYSMTGELSLVAVTALVNAYPWLFKDPGCLDREFLQISDMVKGNKWLQSYAKLHDYRIQVQRYIGTSNSEVPKTIINIFKGESSIGSLSCKQRIRSSIIDAFWRYTQKLL